MFRFKLDNFVVPSNQKIKTCRMRFGPVTAIAAVCLSVLFSANVFALVEITTSDDEKTVIVNDAPEQEIYVIGKSVIVNKNAKGVLAVGGDITVEGNVSGDVATIGGNIIQKENGFIGGDVIVFGGTYKPESQNPLRAAGKETVVIGVFEEELRNYAENPSQLLSPTFSFAFVAQRILLALFWFVISIIFTTLAPGAVSRAVSRIQLSSLKVGGLGSGALLSMFILMIGGALMLPEYLSITFGLMVILTLVLGYVFGRVALQVTIGKMIQRSFLSDQNRSEALATLIGVLVLTFLLSLPYIWPLALFAIFIYGLGLILNARDVTRWQNP